MRQGVIMKVPGTFRLEHIRAVIREINEGVASSNLLGLKTGISTRHVSFAVDAALQLGWLEGEPKSWRPSRSGKALLKTTPGSLAEARVFQRAIAGCEVLELLAPDLLEPHPPAFEELAQRIAERTGLAEASAKRSARVLLSWRRQALRQVEEAPAAPAASSTRELEPPGPGAELPTLQPELPTLQPELTPEGSRQEASVRLVAMRVGNLGPFSSASVELRPFTVLLGDLGSGKSTFVDSLMLVGEAMHLGLPRALGPHAQGLEELLRLRTKGLTLSFELELPEELRPAPALARARYELVIDPNAAGQGVGVTWEALFLKPVGGRPGRALTDPAQAPEGWRALLGVRGDRSAWFCAENADWQLEYLMSRRRLVLAALPDDPSRFSAALGVRSFFRQGIKRIAIDTEAIRRPCSPLAGLRPRPDGSNLALVIRWLRQSEPDRFNRWLAAVRETLPELQELAVCERVEDRHLGLAVTLGGAPPRAAHRLSDGLLRFLALSILPYGGDPWALYLVDEPLGLGARAIEGLCRCWGDPQGHGQILLTTQSPLWAHLAPLESLLCVRRTQGTSSEIVSGRRHEGLKRWRAAIDRQILVDGYL